MSLLKQTDIDVYIPTYHSNIKITITYLTHWSMHKWPPWIEKIFGHCTKNWNVYICCIDLWKVGLLSSFGCRPNCTV